ncbi:hypothetical protein GIB67_032727 [Kingdonia uniflora]|uniref:GHMP kinase C-terminal domain-containing protein n=1 Tax=Kingdonia uniflora TaxID=39325 RepID=A0A7J7MWG3_9MAGN|nr:hypothetical protein GIB67_032727 [Kingdonia uniflora]
MRCLVGCYRNRSLFLLDWSRRRRHRSPAIIGGFVLIRSYDPLDIIQLRFPMEKELFFVLANSKFETPTKKMRAVLPSEIVMLDHISNSSQSGSLGKAFSSDRIVESKLTPLIPGMGAIKNAMIGARAFGCTISGAGPTTAALTDSELRGEKIGEKMVEAFWKEGNLKATSTVRSFDRGFILEFSHRISFDVFFGSIATLFGFGLNLDGEITFGFGSD